MSHKKQTPTPTEIAATTVTDMLHAERTNSFDEFAFHELCATHLDDQRKFEAAKTTFEASREAVRRFVELHGFVPSNAEKTLRCATSEYQASVTRAVGTDIDDSRVEEVQAVCRRARIPSLFPRLFSRKITYSLTPDANKLINTVHIPAKFREAFFAVYSLCFTPVPQSPAVKVIDLVAHAAELQAKETAKAEKAAAKKAGKTAGKKAA